jgi:hypothetical protein
VFASHLAVQDGIYQWLRDEGISVARIHSDDDADKTEAEKEAVPVRRGRG